MNDSYEKRLYAIFHPSPSLIGSQLNPQAFARHYLAGSVRHYTGKIIFAEIDANFRNAYFPIDEYLDQIVPHEDGRPKATKFISVYRVLEHLDLSAIKNLYLTSAEGAVLELEAGEDVHTRDSDILRIFAQINPTKMLVLTRMNFLEFGEDATSGLHAKSVPSLLYTQLAFDAEQFLEDFEMNPMLALPITKLHPSKLRDAILELTTSRSKGSKGLMLNSSFDEIPYRMIRHGFMFARPGESKFFPMPDWREVEKTNYRFWRAM